MSSASFPWARFTGFSLARTSPLPFCLFEAISSAGRRIFLANASFRFSIPSLSILNASCLPCASSSACGPMGLCMCALRPPPHWVRPPFHSTRLAHYISAFAPDPAFAYTSRFVFRGTLTRMDTPLNLDPTTPLRLVWRLACLFDSRLASGSAPQPATRYDVNAIMARIKYA